MSTRLASVLAIAAALSGCVSALPGVTPTATPPSAIPSATTTITATSTPTASLAPTWIATGTSTRDWSATPTQITPTPGIIEVTPVGGYFTPSAGRKMQDISGEYMPYGALNVRVCPDVSNDCPVVDQLSGQVAVQAYGLIVVYPQGDVWLCIDKPPALYVSSNCDRVVAMVIAGKEYGSLVLE